MQFLSIKSIVLLATVAMLSAPTNACKCVGVNGNDHIAATRSCCGTESGIFQDGNDCKASSISNRLSGFEGCCKDSGLASDCGCPTC